MCAAISTLLLPLDLRASQQLTLLPLFWLPPLLAASFASPRQVSWLNLLAMAYGIVHLAWGRSGHHDVDGDQGVAFTAGVIRAAIAIQLSRKCTHLHKQPTSERQRYRLLAEYANDIVIQTDPAFQAIWVSASLQSSLGIQPEQVLGHPLVEFLLPEDQAAWVARQQQATESGATCLRFHRLLGGSVMLHSDGPVVVNLDIDGFQAINDSFGLQTGDRVLRAAATVLRTWLQPEDWLRGWIAMNF